MKLPVVDSAYCQQILKLFVENVPVVEMMDVIGPAPATVYFATAQRADHDEATDCGPVSAFQIFSVLQISRHNALPFIGRTPCRQKKF